MASDINPSLTPTKSLSSFRFWCQKVLPLVYDDSLSYYEVLGKMVVQLNDVIDDVNADTENVLTLKEAFLELQTYVNEFFDDIDQLASYAERAEDAQTAANASAINAASSASNASASSLAAMNARDAAVTAKEAAEASASTASIAATNANTKASEAAQSAITAQTAQASASQSATLAATDRSAAQTAANTATSKANEASTSASNAQTSAENAEQSKDDAEELVNSVQESLDDIQKNTQDINDLKTASSIIINIDEALAHFADGSNSLLEDLVLNNNATKLYVNGKNFANVIEGNIYQSQFNNHTIANNGIILEGTGNYPRLALLVPVKTGYTYTISLKAKRTGNIQRVSAASVLNWEYDYGVIGTNITITSELNQFTLTFTAITDTLYIEIYGGNGTTLTIEDLQVEYGNTATDFEIYNGTIYAIDNGTPTELPKSLNGINNIFSDNGDVSFQYTANTKLYIDNKVAEIQATMLENIGG